MKKLCLIFSFFAFFIMSCGEAEGAGEVEKAIREPPHRIRLVKDEENTPLLSDKDFLRMAGEIYGFAARCAFDGIISPKNAQKLRDMCKSYNQCALKYIEVYGRFVPGVAVELNAEKLLSYSLIEGAEAAQ